MMLKIIELEKQYGGKNPKTESNGSNIDLDGLARKMDDFLKIPNLNNKEAIKPPTLYI